MGRLWGTQGGQKWYFGKCPGLLCFQGGLRHLFFVYLLYPWCVERPLWESLLDLGGFEVVLWKLGRSARLPLGCLSAPSKPNWGALNLSWGPPGRLWGPWGREAKVVLW